MEITEVTTENFSSILFDNEKRSRLLAAMSNECGFFPPLINHVSKIIRKFKTSSEEIDHIVTIELDAGRDEFLCGLIFHPEMDESTVFRIYEAGLCITHLAHRTGPFTLLNQIAKKYRIEEAILTLLLDYYSTNKFTNLEFIQFIQEYSDIHGVRYELLKKTRIPEEKRTLGQQLLVKISL